MLGGKYPSAGHHLLGRVKRLQREYDGAARHFEYLARMDRLDLESLYSLAECRGKAGKYREAVDDLSSATAFFPGSVGIRLRLAEMLDSPGGASASLAPLSAANKNFTLTPRSTPPARRDLSPPRKEGRGEALFRRGPAAGPAKLPARALLCLPVPDGKRT